MNESIWMVSPEGDDCLLFFSFLNNKIQFRRLWGTSFLYRGSVDWLSFFSRKGWTFFYMSGFLYFIKKLWSTSFWVWSYRGRGVWIFRKWILFSCHGFSFSERGQCFLCSRRGRFVSHSCGAFCALSSSVNWDKTFSYFYCSLTVFMPKRFFLCSVKKLRSIS